jgi:hypothetical protein
MKVLVACEESQRVCIAFRERGHEAFSCDIQPPSGGHPEWHIQGDALQAVRQGGWDLMIAHPPCTRLCSSGQRWLYFGPEEYRKQKYEEQRKAIAFFLQLALADVPRIAVENPVGIMSSLYRKPDCIYNPYDFRGETECKKTCLWLKNLPPLKPTQNLPKEKRTQDIWRAHFNGECLAWNDPETAKQRSKTPWGVAEAMAEQWGEL